MPYLRSSVHRVVVANRFLDARKRSYWKQAMSTAHGAKFGTPLRNNGTRFTDYGGIRCLNECDICRDSTPAIYDRNGAIAHGAFCIRAICSRCGTPTGNGSQWWCGTGCSLRGYNMGMLGKPLK
jgi:hypothetical protein